MSKDVVLTARDLRVLPTWIEPGSRAAHRLSKLFDVHLQKRDMGTVLKFEGEANASVYLVLSGWLSISKSTMDGHRQIIDIVLPGGIIETASADGATSAVEIQALTDVSCAAIPYDIWLKVIDETPELGDVVRRETGAALARMSERMLRLGQCDAESIIAFALCELCLRSTGVGLHEVKEFHIPMTQQQLGDLCGLSSVHVYRTLRRHKRKGIVDITDHMDIRIHDIDALAEIAEIDPEDLRTKLVPSVAIPPLKACS